MRVCWLGRISAPPTQYAVKVQRGRFNEIRTHLEGAVQLVSCGVLSGQPYAVRPLRNVGHQTQQSPCQQL